MYFFRIVCREYKSTAKVGGYIEIALVEANPRNVGEKGRYKGVGAHLFAIASQILHANVLHDRIISIRHALFDNRKDLTKIKLCKLMDLLKQDMENRR